MCICGRCVLLKGNTRISVSDLKVFCFALYSDCVQVVKGLLRYWPKTNSAKEVSQFNELAGCLGGMLCF